MAAAGEREALRQAVDLGWRGWGRVHPNPMVGAVLLRDGRVIGEGWHAEYGGPHAEVAAIADAVARGEPTAGATMVVTLEPCRHHGKTPPCTAEIRSAGVARVVYGAADPTAEAGGGAHELRARGIETELLPDAEVERQNAGFFHAARGPDRPFTALKLATSVDARIADFTGRSRWLSGPEARAWVHWLRAGFDAVAVGGRTARADDPQLTARGQLVPRVAPRRVVFDRRGDLTGAARLLESAGQVPVILVAEPGSDPARRAEYQAREVHVIEAAGLTEAMQRLWSAGVRSLLVEGGGRLAGRLMALGLIDRFYWVQAPLWLGDEGIPAFPGLGGLMLEQAGHWFPVERRALGPDTLLVLDRTG